MAVDNSSWEGSFLHEDPCKIPAAALLGRIAQRDNSEKKHADRQHERPSEYFVLESLGYSSAIC